MTLKEIFIIIFKKIYIERLQERKIQLFNFRTMNFWTLENKRTDLPNPTRSEIDSSDTPTN